MLLLLTLACDNTVFQVGSEGGGEAVVGDSYADVQAIFEGNCLSCHSAGAPLGGLDLETDACGALVGVASAYGDPRVDPGNSDGSVLYGKVTYNDAYGPGMPTGSTLPQESIDTIGAWIDGGADCGDGGTTDSGTTDSGTTDSGTTDSGTTDSGTTPGDEYSFRMVREKVFDPHCISCHTAGEEGERPTGLDLETTDAHALLVGVASSEEPGVLRVAAGDPENSYLYQKVSGLAATGGRMPLRGDALGAEDIDLVYGWIQAGAPQ